MKIGTARIFFIVAFLCKSYAQNDNKAVNYEKALKDVADRKEFITRKFDEQRKILNIEFEEAKAKMNEVEKTSVELKQEMERIHEDANRQEHALKKALMKRMAGFARKEENTKEKEKKPPKEGDEKTKKGDHRVAGWPKKTDKKTEEEGHRVEVLAKIDAFSQKYKMLNEQGDTVGLQEALVNLDHVIEEVMKSGDEYVAKAVVDLKYRLTQGEGYRGAEGGVRKAQGQGYRGAQ